MDPVRIRNDKLAQKVVAALKRRNFDAHYVQTAEEARQLALSLLPEGTSVSWGGSTTLKEIGLYDALHAGNYDVLDRDEFQGEDRMDAMRRALLCDNFVTGVNAISEDGVLVHVDGLGNRVAAICYGPKNVIIVAGINKIAPTAQAAHVRARHVAAPINAQRNQDNHTGCIVTGACENCLTGESLCCYTVETRVCRPAGKIKVILVNEQLGF